MLYDFATDPGEKTDLAKDKPDVVAKAVTLMRDHRTDDPNWPLDTGSRKIKGK